MHACICADRITYTIYLKWAFESPHTQVLVPRVHLSSFSFSSFSPRHISPLQLTMDSTVHLCDHCSQICFDALRGPSISDLHAISDGHMRMTRAAGVTHKVHLASLARIEQSAADGGSLCQLFLHVIGRQGGGALLLPARRWCPLLRRPGLVVLRSHRRTRLEWWRRRAPSVRFATAVPHRALKGRIHNCIY